MLRRVVSCMLATLAPFLACDDGPVPQPCSDIPAGGCPIARGVSCSDPACEAVYACRPGNVWELQQRCPERDGATRPPPLDAGGDEPTAPVIDASIDAPEGAFGGPGCPSLQAPDCSLGLALSCGAGCCGCEDLYVCEDEAWTLWGACVHGVDGGVHAGR